MTIHLSVHARERIADRDLTEAVIEAVASSPAVTGSAGHGAQFRCAPAVLGTRRAWVTVIVGRDAAGGECVVTAYRGMPRNHPRIRSFGSDTSSGYNSPASPHAGRE